jgi:hypothetical protein
MQGAGEVAWPEVFPYPPPVSRFHPIAPGNASNVSAAILGLFNNGADKTIAS